MSEYGITETGFRIKRFDTILAEINADQSEGFGVQVGANTRSFLNVMNTSVADKLAELWEVAADIYHNLSPMSAEGASSTMRCSSAGPHGSLPAAPTIPSIVSVRRASPSTPTR